MAEVIERHAQLNQPMNGRVLIQNGGHRRCVGQTDAKRLSLCLAQRCYVEDAVASA